MKQTIKLISSISFVVCLFSFSACNNAKSSSISPEPKSNEELYQLAVNDAVVAESSEIKPLVNLTTTDQYATIQDDKTLLVTFHHYPNSYVPGTTNENIGYYMWTFTEKEMKAWYQANSSEVSDWHLRFCQLLGMNDSSTNSYFSAVWANLSDVIRPAYITDTTKEMKNTLDDGLSQDYINWFNSQYVYSFSSENPSWRSPWTRLGYTYDWADNNTEYGLSEFLINKGSTVKVEYTKTIDEFVTYLSE